ncbi:MAG: hypothetical protein H0W97_06360 [Actinobacteria bacterium]|nr:hypothetical protein [Actinomycetota bacterium]
MSTLRRSPLLLAAIALLLPLVSAPAMAAPPGVPRLGLRAAAASVEVILGGVLGARTVSVPPWHGIDTEMWFGFGG